ncbi:MAG: M24 family metallopeptidase [Polyangiaceae bacterium]
MCELVLAAQRPASARRPGALEAVYASVQVIAKGLVDLGLLSGTLEEVLEKQSYKKFFMHRTSHYLGMDVHDIGRYYLEGTPAPCSTGVMITVEEPGIYVAEMPKACRRSTAGSASASRMTCSSRRRASASSPVTSRRRWTTSRGCVRGRPAAPRPRLEPSRPRARPAAAAARWRR